MSHKALITLMNGDTRCVKQGIPRVLEVKSTAGEVVAWLCLDCDEQVEPYTDKQRVLLVNEDQIERNELWYDQSVGAWVTTPLEGKGPPSNRPIPDQRVLKEPVFWEHTEKTPF